LDSILRTVTETFKITNIIAMNDFILAVYSENVLGLGVYYDPSILSTIVATSP
jgi:hypothetical protein